MSAPQAFAVRFELRSPVIMPSKPLHLDALLASVVVQQAFRCNDADPYSAQEDLPLARAGSGDDWVWCASQLVFVVKDKGMKSVVRPYDICHWAAEKGRSWDGSLNSIPQGTGPFKGYKLALPEAWVEYVYAWGVGDVDSVAAILADVPGIGAHQRTGCGLIKEILIAPTTEQGLWRRRVLPEGLQSEALEDHLPGTSTLRAPYWQRINAKQCLEWQDNLSRADLRASFPERTANRIVGATA